MRVGKSALCSKRLIVAPPLVPARSASHVEGTSCPTGVTTPMPVTTTRGFRPRSALIVSAPPALLGLAVLLQIGDRVAHGPHLLGVLVRDVDTELLLERHHQLDRVQR